MSIDANNIEQIVKQVLSEMKGTALSSASSGGAGVPQKARVAVLTKLEHFDIKEYPVPALGDDDILVKKRLHVIYRANLFCPRRPVAYAPGFFESK